MTEQDKNTESSTPHQAETGTQMPTTTPEATHALGAVGINEKSRLAITGSDNDFVDTPEMREAHELQERALELIQSPFRPDTREVAELVRAGLTSENILAAGEVAGYERPHMERTLEELPVIVDYIQQASDVLARDPRRKVFAARDGEYNYDDFVTRYPDSPALLLNASGPLFDSLSKALKKEENSDIPPERVERFFSAYGLTDEALREQPLVIVDPGFRGTVGSRISSLIERLRGEKPSDQDAPKYVKNGLLTVKMLSVQLDSPLATEILNSADFPEEVKTGEAFPKTSAYMGKDAFNPDWQPGAALVSAIQLLPHHTHPYGDLIDRDGIPTSVPTRRVTPDNATPYIDQSANDRSAHANTSICHPVGALIVQAEVVRRALEV